MDITLLQNIMVRVILKLDDLATSYRMKDTDKVFHLRISFLFFFSHQTLHALTAHMVEQRLTDSIITLVEVINICLFCLNLNLNSFTH